MLAIKDVILISAVSLFLMAAGIVVHDLLASWRDRREAEASGQPHPAEIRWRTSVALVLLAWLPLLIAFSIAVMPSRHADASHSARTLVTAIQR